jgi:hypothetical protein
MKRILLFVLATLTVSCSDFLTVQPTDFLTEDSYYKKKEHFEAALVSVYDVLGQGGLYGSNMFSRMANEADEGYYAREKMITGPQVYNFSSSDEIIEAMWKACYLGINRANELLSRIDDADINEPVKNRIKGEALFLRAYYYFLLVQYWGDVPLLLKPTRSTDHLDVARTSKDLVYERILRDMKEAESLVDGIENIGYGGRVSRSAVRGILARVCLYMAGETYGDKMKYLEARDYAKAVMDDEAAGHALNPDYSQVFINYAQDKYDPAESIWEVEFWGNLTDAYTETGKVGAWIGIQYSHADLTINPSYGYIDATGVLYDKYEEGDVRRDWNISPFKYLAYGQKEMYADTEKSHWTRNVGKWRREYETLKNTTYNSSQNYPLLRYSDVLLMFAEAENEIKNGPSAEALAALNAVRDRAGASLIAEGLDKASFLKVIQDERARELCFESLRKQDLIRWGILIPTLKNVATQINFVAPNAYYTLSFNNINERHLLFPIPSHEMALNKKLVQNPNW